MGNKHSSDQLLSQFNKDVLQCSGKSARDKSGDDELQQCLTTAMSARPESAVITTVTATKRVAVTRGVTLGHH
jgi:hypothetical protein